MDKGDPELTLSSFSEGQIWSLRCLNKKKKKKKTEKVRFSVWIVLCNMEMQSTSVPLIQDVKVIL